MKVAVTGATGFIGSKLVEQLLKRGYEVNALFRSESKKNHIPDPALHYIHGDITQPESIEKLMSGCEQLFHVAAFAGIWHRDENHIFNLNVNAALQVFELAGRAGIRKCVFTSSAAVFGPSDGTSLDENSPAPESYFVPYERSKARMEKAVLGENITGTEVVVVNPTRLYGPGLLNDGNSVTRMIKMYRDGKWHLVPGNGKSSGNYVFIDDVVQGHLLAMEKGRHGERYILGGENASYNEFFSLLDDALGNHYRLFRVPLPLMLILSGVLIGMTRLTGKPPAITPGLVRKYSKHFSLSSAKAKNELGYDPRGLKLGLSETIAWLNQTYPIKA
jgi:nucleoside-diphosphate-sugar epimerase